MRALLVAAAISGAGAFPDFTDGQLIQFAEQSQEVCGSTHKSSSYFCIIFQDAKEALYERGYCFAPRRLHEEVIDSWQGKPRGIFERCRFNDPSSKRRKATTAAAPVPAPKPIEALRLRAAKGESPLQGLQPRNGGPTVYSKKKYNFNR